MTTTSDVSNPTLHTVPNLIGLSGYAQSGKDTVGRLISELYGHEPVSFSDCVRRFIYAQDLYLPNGQRLNEVVDQMGWDMARVEHPYIRILQQKTGLEAGRQTLYDRVWVDAALRPTVPEGRYVFTSVRFPNEATAITEAGGVLVRVHRVGITAVNDHASDSALDDWPFDLHLYNSGGLDQLRKSIAWLLGELP